MIRYFDGRPDQQDSSTTQTPVVTTFIALDLYGGAADGLLGGTFQGFDPAVTGGLTFAIGNTAYEVPGQDSRAAALVHVLAETSVKDPTVLGDLNFTTPANGPDNGLAVDIGIASTTAAFGSVLIPFGAAIAGSALGNELAPLANLTAGLLKGYGKNGGVPTGGSTDAAPVFYGAAGLGLSQTLTLLGVPTVTSEGGSLALSRGVSNLIGDTLQDSSTLYTDTNALVGDVMSGNIPGAIAEGVATLGDAALLGSAVGSLLLDSQNTPPHLPAINTPTLSLDANIGDSQTFGLGVGTPTQLNETLNLQITADKFGAYALGELLAQYAPQLIADLSGGTTQTMESLFAQMAQGVSALASTVVGGVTGDGTYLPSKSGAPDIAINATLVTTEQNDIIGGSVTNSQTFTLNFETNAQGFYDLGSSAQAVLIPLLVGALETPAGQEALQIGGEILQQIDSKFGGGGNTSSDILTPYVHAGHVF